jgi:hypothetical protein
MNEGRLLTFSGLDAAGKSTQIDQLMHHRRQNGDDPVYVWVRGGYTPLFESLKARLCRLPGRAIPPPGHHPPREQAFRRGWVRRLWLVAALLDLLWLLGVRVRGWRRRGRTVVCDRGSINSP